MVRELGFSFFLWCICLTSGRRYGADIIGGRDADPAQFPYQVYLRITGHMCGGSLVADNVVLTACHCVDDVDLSILTVVGGTTNRFSGGESVEVEYIKSHPECNPKTNVHDLAIIFLKKPFSNKTKIQPIDLPNVNQSIPEGAKAVVSGWGLAGKYEDEKATMLKFAKIPIWKESKCKEFITPYRGEICAGNVDGLVGACRGDSGGPLTYRGTLLGLVSWGYGCGTKQTPSIFTNIALYREWIRKTANI